MRTAVVVTLVVWAAVPAQASGACAAARDAREWNTWFLRCAANGAEYLPKQCNTLTGACWCVDPATGESLAVPLSTCEGCTLAAADDAAAGARNATSRSCRADGTYQGVQNLGGGASFFCVDRYTGVGIECDSHVKLGCGYARETAASELLLNGVPYVPQCDADGEGFLPKQCNTAGRCWCVDPATGKALNVWLATCETCALHAAEAFGMGKAIRTLNCRLDGTYQSVQNLGRTGSLFCVDRYTGADVECDSQIKLGCGYARELASAHVFYGRFPKPHGKDPHAGHVPQCDADGEKFLPKQCDLTGACWCVDPATGESLNVSLSTCEKCALAAAAFRERIPGVTVCGYGPSCRGDGTYAWIQPCVRGMLLQCLDTNYFCADRYTGASVECYKLLLKTMPPYRMKDEGEQYARTPNMSLAP